MAKHYLRKAEVAARYSTTVRNVDRMAADGRIPKPMLFNGRQPLWSPAELDENDRRAAVERAGTRPVSRKHATKIVGSPTP